MNSRTAFCAVALGATLLATTDALAKGGRRGGKRGQTVELTRPEGAVDANATGVVRVEKGRRGDQTVIQLSHLDPRTLYEVRDAATGETLGEVRTNRRGRATFNLTRTLTKAASVDGSEGGVPGDVSDVEIVDPSTGDCVLEGGVDVDPWEGFTFGYGDYENDAGDFASISMQSAPAWDSESFSVTMFPIQESFAAAFFDLYLDTANGDELPLGAQSVSELAGRGFQIVSPEGTVLIDDVLPELTAQDDWFNTTESWDSEWTEGDWNGGQGDRWADPGIWAGPDGDWWDGGFDWNDTTGGKDDWSYDEMWDMGMSSDPTERAGRNHMKTGRLGGVREEPSVGGEEPVAGYTIRIEDENGDLQDAGVLEQVLYDKPIECPWGGDHGDFDGIDIGIIIVPIDGSFDWQGLLDKLLGGSFDFGSFDPADWADANGLSGARRSR